MTFHAMTERYEEITVCGKPALFTSIRIRRDTIPDGLYAYDVRHDDECRGIPCEIAPFTRMYITPSSTTFRQQKAHMEHHPCGLFHVTTQLISSEIPVQYIPALLS